jgi:hypothetical protein
LKMGCLKNHEMVFYKFDYVGAKNVKFHSDNSSGPDDSSTHYLFGLCPRPKQTRLI